MIIIPLTSSYSEKSNPSDFVLITIGIIGLLIWILYWMHAEHVRLLTNFQQSGILEFLEESDFTIEERSTGWNYELDIQGTYNKCLIKIDVMSEKGNIWNKYYLILEGLATNEIREIDEGTLDVQTYLYPEKIRLTKDTESKSTLEMHLEKFSEELIQEKTTTNTSYPQASVDMQFDSFML